MGLSHHPPYHLILLPVREGAWPLLMQDCLPAFRVASSAPRGGGCWLRRGQGGSGSLCSMQVRMLGNWVQRAGQPPVGPFLPMASTHSHPHPSPQPPHPSWAWQSGESSSPSPRVLGSREPRGSHVCFWTVYLMPHNFQLGLDFLSLRQVLSDHQPAQGPVCTWLSCLGGFLA